MSPEEYECHFRRSLHKSLPQPEFPRPEIWYVEPEGKNLEAVLSDAQRAIEEIGLAWFDQFNNGEAVLQTLLERSEGSDISGFGTKTSPIRNFMTGFVALSLGRRSLAKERITKALESCFLKEFEPEMKAALQTIDEPQV